MSRPAFLRRPRVSQPAQHPFEFNSISIVHGDHSAILTNHAQLPCESPIKKPGIAARTMPGLREPTIQQTVQLTQRAELVGHKPDQKSDRTQQQHRLMHRLAVFDHVNSAANQIP